MRAGVGAGARGADPDDQLGDRAGLQVGHGRSGPQAPAQPRDALQPHGRRALLRHRLPPGAFPPPTSQHQCTMAILLTIGHM